MTKENELPSAEAVQAGLARNADHTPQGGIMTSGEQLRRWIDDEPTHNGASREDGECTPDFSCCTPGTLWSIANRLRFVAGDDRERFGLLGTALSALSTRETSQ